MGFQCARREFCPREWVICLRAGGARREQQNQKGFSLPKGRFSNRRSVFREAGAQSPFENLILGRLLCWLGRELPLINMAPIFLHKSGSAYICILSELQENKQKLKW